MPAASIVAIFGNLVGRDKRAFAHLGLVMRDGTPHVTPTWFDYDGTFFYFNTARGRVKDRIMRRHPRVGFDIQDPENAYRYIQVRGPVVGETEEGAEDCIRSLNEKYMGDRNYPLRPGEVRVTYTVLPEHVSGMA